MANQPLMPKATAVWLVDNTALSFEQIAVFCNLHPLEIKAIADGEAAEDIKGLSPVMTGQLAQEEISKGESDPNYRLKFSAPKIHLPEKKRKGPRYTPLSKRHDRPNVILWLIAHHENLKDSQIARLVGTTKSTIEQIRNHTHWNYNNLVALDPVTLGFCSQIDLDTEVARVTPAQPPIQEQDETLLPASFTENLEFRSDDNHEFLDKDRIFARISSSETDPEEDH